MKLKLETYLNTPFVPEPRYADRDGAVLVAGVRRFGAACLFYKSPASLRTDRVPPVLLFEKGAFVAYVSRMTRETVYAMRDRNVTGVEANVRFENGYVFGGALNVQEGIDAVEEALDLWGPDALDLRLPGGRYEREQAFLSNPWSSFLALTAAGAVAFAAFIGLR